MTLEDLKKVFTFGEETEIIETKNFSHLVKLISDDYGESPRGEDNNNLFTMVCKHRSYALGDEQTNLDTLHEVMHDIMEFDCLIDTLSPYYDVDLIDWDTYKSRIEDKFEKNYVWDYLSLYDHSGITMSRGSGTGWDSGVVGIIYASKEHLRKELDFKKLTKDRLKKIDGYLTGEVETYDNYLTGNVYGCTVQSLRKIPVLPTMPVEVIDEDSFEDIDEESCWGFYGDHRESGILDYVLEIIGE